MFSPALLNAARAFAMAAFSDGRLSHEEERRFARLVDSEPLLKASDKPDAASAWRQAVREVQASQSFGGPLVSIRSEITAPADKLLMIRAAQAAVVADGKLDPQENVAIRTLAEALGLNPDEY